MAWKKRTAIWKPAMLGPEYRRKKNGALQAPPRIRLDEGDLEAWQPQLMFLRNTFQKCGKNKTIIPLFPLKI